MIGDGGGDTDTVEFIGKTIHAQGKHVQEAAEQIDLRCRSAWSLRQFGKRRGDFRSRRRNRLAGRTKTNANADKCNGCQHSNGKTYSKHDKTSARLERIV